ncbi:hypothetical protein I656_01379 [Geobacillus sp. WSUCF1]|nr:hypothetical protein I656_01379 [Geobacillus sp. WSUCF1]
MRQQAHRIHFHAAFSYILVYPNVFTETTALPAIYSFFIV